MNRTNVSTSSYNRNIFSAADKELLSSETEKEDRFLRSLKLSKTLSNGRSFAAHSPPTNMASNVG